jgi:hypothetical protein
MSTSSRLGITLRDAPAWAGDGSLPTGSLMHTTRYHALPLSPICIHTGQASPDRFLKKQVT